MYCRDTSEEFFRVVVLRIREHVISRAMFYSMSKVHYKHFVA